MQSNSKPKPALAGAANCKDVIGPNWKHVRAHAIELGVPLLRIGRKDFVEVDAYLEAVRNNNSAAPTVATADPAATVRQIVLRRAGWQ